MEEFHKTIKAGENKQQIFITHISSADEMAKFMSALANTEGGSIWLGVKKNGKVVGVYPKTEIKYMHEAIDLLSSPKIEWSSCEYQDRHKFVLEVKVKEIPSKPVLVTEQDGKKKAYVRSGTATILANKIMLGVWKKREGVQRQSTEFSTEEQVIFGIIEKEGKISLAQLYRQVKLKKNLVDKLLIKLILDEKVILDNTKECITYSIAKK